MLQIDDKLTALIEAHCKKYGTVWLHKDDIEPIVKEWLESLTEKEVLELYKLVKKS